MLRTLGQNSQLHALITKLGIDTDAKEEMVHDFTGGRETSSSKMTVKECDALIKHLQSFTGPAPGDKMRKKILSMCYEMNWTNDKGGINWTKLNDYLVKYGYLHKGLNKYTAKELPLLVTQFEGLLRSFYSK